MYCGAGAATAPEDTRVLMTMAKAIGIEEVKCIVARMEWVYCTVVNGEDLGLVRMDENLS